MPKSSKSRPDVRRRERDTAESPDWLGIFVRGFFGAAFGAALGAGELFWFADTLDRIIGWSLFVACVVICTFLAIRYGDDFWTGLRDWIWPLP